MIADKAYSSATNRALLRRKRIRAVIPERSDQLAHRKRRGRRGGRAPDFDRQTYKRRNVVERAFNKAKHWRAGSHPLRQVDHHLPHWSRPSPDHRMAQVIGRHNLGPVSQHGFRHFR
ncbi:transposase [Nocardia gipuzkoensis]|uniref:transposase n=1 Tax=Nocardia gipuzkoensis TaxID=2749991 RepID=UPI0015EF8635